jgi:parallel beta-helix repeat protein
MSQSSSDDNFPPLSANGSGHTGFGSAAKPKVRGYTIVEQIAEGGMGSVWRAVQLSTNRQVALKLIGAKALGSERARARFEREVEVAAHLNHPNIASVFDSGLREGSYYYAMELIKGEPLDAYVQHHNLSLRQILVLMQAVCNAVQHAHQLGVIHRDLKPSNILVTDDGQPHVVDFGLAKAVLGPSSQLTLSMDGQLVGTLPYMSPEQALGRSNKLDTRTDVYSLGIILYRLLTGKPTHDLTGSNYVVMRRIAEEDIIRPRQQNPQIDRELEAVLLKSLAHNPENRYSTAGEFGADIKRYLHAEPLAAKRPTTFYFLKKRVYKHRAPVLTGALISVTLIIAVITVTTISRQRKAKAIRQFKAQASFLLEEDEYQAAEEAFAKVLALNKDDPDAQKGITESRNRRELARDLKLARLSLGESEFDRALGIALSAQQRFPEDARVRTLVHQARGTTTLSVNFALGQLREATLKRISTEANDAAVSLDVDHLVEGVDIEPGWYWLNLHYQPVNEPDNTQMVNQKYLLFVQRSIPYKLDVREVVVGNLPDADFGNLSDALRNCRAGHILLLAPGEHSPETSELLEVRVYTPNIRIESGDPNRPGTVTLNRLYVHGIWDFRISGITVQGFQKEGEAYPAEIHIENSAFCRVSGCTLRSTAIDATNCDGVELSSNRFFDYAQHQSAITDSYRVVLRSNEAMDSDGFRSFVLDRSSEILILDNKISRAGLIGLCLHGCGNCFILGNTIENSNEGEMRLNYCKDVTVAFNNLCSRREYGILLTHDSWSVQDVHSYQPSGLEGILLAHNFLSGGRAGVLLQSAYNVIYTRNVITGTGSAIYYEGGGGHWIEKNVFAKNDATIAAKPHYWGAGTVTNNLMDRPVDNNSLHNTWLDVKADNSICQFEPAEPNYGSCACLIEAVDSNSNVNLPLHEYGPLIDLKEQYLTACNRLADAALEYAQATPDVRDNKGYGCDLDDRMALLEDTICSAGRPRVDERLLRCTYDFLVGTQEVAENPGIIPEQAR